jgi:RNA polymerase sigma factor (sigma-70 family)
MEAYVDDAEAAELWRQYYPRLKRAIAHHARGLRHPLTDASEVAGSAIHSFLWRAREGRFQELDEPSGTWKLLKTIALRKAKDHHRKLKAQKRGGDRVILRESQQADDHDRGFGVDQIPDGKISPESDEEVSDLFNRLLEKAPDDTTRDIVLLRLQGGTYAEIAEAMGISNKTVRRRLNAIEQTWQRAFLGAS